MPCECPRSPAHCVACRVAQYIAQQRIRVGAPLWPGATPAISLAALQRVLTLLRVAAPTSYTWKAVRAGHATELALTPGVSLADIMKRGEWRSGSVLAYVRPDDVHVPTFGAQTMDMSDAEADDDLPTNHVCLLPSGFPSCGLMVVNALWRELSASLCM